MTTQPKAPVADAVREALEAARSELKEHNAEYQHRTKPEVFAKIDAALAALTPAPLAGLEPRGCPTPGACSCPVTAPGADSGLREALEAVNKKLDEIWDTDDRKKEIDGLIKAKGIVRVALAAQPVKDK